MYSKVENIFKTAKTTKFLDFISNLLKQSIDFKQLLFAGRTFSQS